VASRKVSLQVRDLTILEYLLEQRAETLDELHRIFFSGQQRHTAHNRLCRLQSAGFVQGLSVATAPTTARPTRAYVLGPRATAALRLRSLAGDHLRGRQVPVALRGTSVPHQLAVNLVGHWIDAALTGEHLLGDTLEGRRRHRPDAVYQAAEADRRGRDLVFVEVDLGHYSRARILGKLTTFLAHSRGKHVLFAVPSAQRQHTVNEWLRDEHGDTATHRISVHTFEQLRDQGLSVARAAPATPGRSQRDWRALASPDHLPDRGIARPPHPRHL
jgi:hypothetical protein